MGLFRLLWAAVLLSAVCFAQAGTEEFEVYTEHPRLLLKAQRLRLLRRERERQSARWLQFDALVSGGAQLPEPGLSLALHYQVSGNEGSGRKAIQWALSSGGVDLRQIAFVFDWCQPLLSETESKQLLAKLDSRRESGDDIQSARARVLSAIASAGQGKADARSALEQVVQQWWRKRMAPALKSGNHLLSHTEVYPLFEMLHAVRDNLQIDLRNDAPQFFKELPAERLLSYYPAPYPSAENDYRIPYYDGKGAPNLAVAAMTRVSELSMVAFDSNALESQFLQGWLLHDRFLLRSPGGIPYEFLWANPYQPGLTYQHMPTRFHDSRTGSLFVRSSWDEDATWAVYRDGRMQVFDDGKIQAGTVPRGKPLIIGKTGLVSGPAPLWLHVKEEEPTQWFVVGLKPGELYDIEVEDEELVDGKTDRSGILSIPELRSAGLSVRIREPRVKINTAAR